MAILFRGMVSISSGSSSDSDLGETIVFFVLASVAEPLGVLSRLLLDPLSSDSETAVLRTALGEECSGDVSFRGVQGTTIGVGACIGVMLGGSPGGGPCIGGKFLQLMQRQ